MNGITPRCYAARQNAVDSGNQRRGEYQHVAGDRCMRPAGPPCEERRSDCGGDERQADGTVEPLTQQQGGERHDEECFGGEQQCRMGGRGAIQAHIEEQERQPRLEHAEQEQRRPRSPRSGAPCDGERGEHDRPGGDLHAEEVDGHQLLECDLAQSRREAPEECRRDEHRNGPDQPVCVEGRASRHRNAPGLHVSGSW